MTLKLSLREFKCWGRLDLEFQPNSVVLIRGDSGKGKTSIFQAIVWCLFGGEKNVAPKTKERAKTKVKIILPNGHKIIRRKGPPSFSIYLNKEIRKRGKIVQLVLENEDAKQYILDNFGTSESWMATSYIVQGNLNSFLTSSNIEKMKLLNQLAFKVEDPSEDITKIDESTTEFEILHKAKSINYSSSLSKYEILSEGVDIGKRKDRESMDRMIKQLDHNKKDLRDLTKIQHKRDELLKMIDRHQDDMNKQKKHLLENLQLPEPNEELETLSWEICRKSARELVPDDLSQCYSKLEFLKKRDQLVQEKLFLTHLIDGTGEDVLSITQTFQNKDLYDTKTIEEEYEKNFRVTWEMGIEYEQDSIDRKKDEIQKMLDANQILDVQFKLKKVVDSIQTMENELLPKKKKDLEELERNYFTFIDDYLENENQRLVEEETRQMNKLHLLRVETADLFESLTIKKKELENLRTKRGTYACPKCSTSLRYDAQRSMIICTDEHPFDERQYNSLMNEIEEMTGLKMELTKTERSLLEMIGEIQKRKEELIQESQQEHHQYEVQKIKLENDVHQYESKIKTQMTLQEVYVKNLRSLGLDDSQLLDMAYYEQQSKSLGSKSKETLSSMLGRLSTVKIIPKPSHSSEFIQKVMNYQKNKNKLDKVLISLEEIMKKEGEDGDKTLFSIQTDRMKRFIDLGNQFLKIQSKIMGMREECNSKLKYCQEILEGKLFPELPPDHSGDCENLERLTKTLEKNIEDAKISEKVFEAKRVLDLEKNSLIELEEKLSKNRELRKEAVETECSELQCMVDSINESLNDICSDLFEDGISILLNLFKSIKSKKGETKAMVNFVIGHSGGIYDGIFQLSGGEQHRISLALTLAMSRFSPSPFILLDESFANLDVELKSAAIKCIQDNTDKIVLCVMHDGVEGIYDETIDINSLRNDNDIMMII